MFFTKKHFGERKNSEVKLVLTRGEEAQWNE